MSDLENAISNVIKLIDSDPDREGLVETPKRVAKFFKEFYTKEAFTVTTFNSEGYDEMITQLNIPFYSMCEHHILPFFGVGHVAYIPRDRIIGLSKLSRSLDHFAHNLQNQERITTQVADFLEENLNPQGVAVVLTARHMCMEMRGVKKIGTETTTASLRGAFKSSEPTRLEFYQMIK